MRTQRGGFPRPSSMRSGGVRSPSWDRHRPEECRTPSPVFSSYWEVSGTTSFLAYLFIGHRSSSRVSLSLSFFFSVLGSGMASSPSTWTSGSSTSLEAPAFRTGVEEDDIGDGLAARGCQLLSLCVLLPACCTVSGLSGLTELPATTVERRLPARTQGRTVGRTLTRGADCILTSVQGVL